MKEETEMNILLLSISVFVLWMVVIKQDVRFDSIKRRLEELERGNRNVHND